MSESKIHYCEHIDYIPPCGATGRKTMVKSIVTCRACWFHILVAAAPWARGFLDELRGKPRSRQPDAISVPGATAAPVDGKEKGLGNGFARAFSQKRLPQKVISELLSTGATILAPVEPIVDHSRPPRYAVWVKKGQVAEQAGDAGQVGHEVHGDFQPPV